MWVENDIKRVWEEAKGEENVRGDDFKKGKVVGSGDIHVLMVSSVLATGKYI